MATTSAIGDITLGNKNYRVDIASWREKDIIDFAPRASVPGGSVVMSDLGLYQPLVQTDWQHGFGFHWYSDAAGYLSTTGKIDTRQDGLVMLYTNSTSSDTNNNAKSGFVVFNGALYSWGAAGLRKYSGGSWAAVSGASAAVNWAINAGDYLLFAPDGARVQKMNTSDTVSNAGVDANATDYRWLIIHNGLIYAGKDATNRIHVDNNADLSQLEGTSSDTDAIYCGIGNMPTLGAIVFAGNLYVSRQDGLWLIGEDRIARRVLDFTNEISSNNFRSMAVINGYLVFPIRDQIYQWNGNRVANITPPKITDVFPYVTYGRFTNFIAADNFLYCTARTNETTYYEALLAWDGVGWHKLSDIVTNGTDTISAVGYDSVNNYLWYHVDATADATYYIQQQNFSPFPYANFPTSGTHSVISSRLDMGFRRIKKSMTSLLVEARNCSSARYISVYYQIDGDGTWHLWDTIKSNGVIELSNPGSNKTREFDYANLRFDFTTDSSAQSPILESWTLRFIMRPNVLWGYSFYIVAANYGQHGVASDERTAAEIRDELLELRDSKSPIRLVDPLGITHYGYITSVQGQPDWRLPGEDGEPDEIEMRWLLNYTEVENAN